MSFNILAIGDVMGRPGRQALEAGLTLARQQINPDFILINGENLAGGFGITKKLFEDVIGRLGVDCVTTGNHWMDKREVYEFMDHNRLVLPANMQNVERHKQGLRVIEAKTGEKVAVINLIGRIFMKGDNHCPYDFADKILQEIPSYIKIRICDFHAEATSEKQGLAHYLAGRVSVFYGTHSHVPTADERVISHHTGFVTDLGMTGPYDSVIGIQKDAAIRRMRTGEKRGFEPAKDDLWLYGCVFRIDKDSGVCLGVERLRLPIKNG